MKTIKVSELSGTTLEWSVSKAIQPGWESWRTSEHVRQGFHPSTDWTQGGPIIEREKICIAPDSNYELRGGRWSAVDWEGNIVECAPTPLIAAMRCYVASKLGDEVEVPEELL